MGGGGFAKFLFSGLNQINLTDFIIVVRKISPPNRCALYIARYTWNVVLAIQHKVIRACVCIYIRQLDSFRAPTLWFIDLTVATCHIQYTFLSLCQLFCFHEKTNKTRKYSKSAIFV